MVQFHKLSHSCLSLPICIYFCCQLAVILSVFVSMFPLNKNGVNFIYIYLISPSPEIVPHYCHLERYLIV